MFELFKIVWDLIVMRDAVHKKQLNLRKGLIAAGLTTLGYLILVPAAALYEKHPQYKPLFIAAIVLTAIDFAFLIGLGLYWWRQTLANPQ